MRAQATDRNRYSSSQPGPGTLPTCARRPLPSSPTRSPSSDALVLRPRTRLIRYGTKTIVGPLPLLRPPPFMSDGLLPPPPPPLHPHLTSTSTGSSSARHINDPDLQRIVNLHELGLLPKRALDDPSATASRTSLPPFSCPFIVTPDSLRRGIHTVAGPCDGRCR